MCTTSTINTLPKGSWVPFKAMTFTAFCCSLGAVSAQTSVLLPVAHDVSVGYHDNFNSANTNYNTSIHFSAFSQPGNDGGVNKGRGLMDFDLSVIPDGSTILGAFLNLTAHGPFAGVGTVATVGSTGQNTCTLRRVTSAWNDATVTWNTQPSNTMDNSVALAQSAHVMQNYYSIDVTALVQNMVADPTNSFGFMLVLDDETPSRGLIFHSGVADYPDQRPSLLVVYGDCGIGMGELNGASMGLQVTPNIAAPGEVITLNLPGSMAQPARLEVLDAAGRLVWNGPLRQWPAAWAVPALSQGAYTLTVKDRDNHSLGTARAVVR